MERATKLSRVLNDQLPDAMARTGEALVRLYMQQAAPSIQPASIEQPFQGVLGMVRIRGQVDIVDVDGTIIDIVTATKPPGPHRYYAPV